MYNTVKMFQQYVIWGKLNEPLESLAVEYQATHSQALFATIFYKVFKLAITESHQFFGLSEQDIASWSVEKLHDCLTYFDRTQNMRFTTYYGVALRNKFKEEINARNMQKRKIAYFSDSLEQALERGFDYPAPDEDTTILELETNKLLTEREKKFCYMVVQHYSSLEIAKTLGVSQMTLTNIKKQLRYKFKC